MPAYQREIASDLSVFHRIDDPMGMDSSRYFEFAELLKHYAGAVRARRVREEAAAAPVQASPPPAPRVEPQRPAPTGGQGRTRLAIEDMSLMASLSKHPGFPGIGYRS